MLVLLAPLVSVEAPPLSVVVALLAPLVVVVSPADVVVSSELDPVLFDAGATIFVTEKTYFAELMVRIDFPYLIVCLNGTDGLI